MGFSQHSSNGKCLTEASDIAERWTEYCKELYNHPSLDSLADTDEGDRTESLPVHVLQLPSEDWGFNVFLDDLASNISKEELARLKNYVSGDGGLGLRVLEQIDSPLDLFKILKKRMIVSKDNLITLQGMLWHLKNKELHTKAVEYARNVGNTLYFYAPSDMPENGYKYVKIHVQGRDFSKIRRSDLEQLRTTVSQLVMIPAQFVLVSGLEPSSSFIITFMMPEYYVSVFVEIISRQTIHDLTELGVDTIHIDDKKFPLSGADKSEVLQSRDEQTVAKTFARLHLAEQQLEQRDIEYLKLSRELESSRQELKQADQNKQNIGVLVDNLYQLHLFQTDLLKPIFGEVASLKIQSALANWRFSLRKVKDLNYDTDVIMNLLQANSYLVDIRVRAEFVSRMKYMMTDLEIQKALIVSQQQSIQLLQFVSGSNPQEALSIVLSYLLNTFQQFASTSVVNIPFPAIQILRKYSRLLDEKERQNLQKFHTWTTEENGIVEKNPSVFLEMLAAKESQHLKGPINLTNFIPPLFEKVQRNDLARGYVDDVKKMETEQRRKSNDSTAHGPQLQPTALNEQQRSQQLDEMNTRLMNVEKMLKELSDNIGQSPYFFKDFMSPLNMPIWGSKISSFLKEQKEAERFKQPVETF